MSDYSYGSEDENTQELRRQRGQASSGAIERLFPGSPLPSSLVDFDPDVFLNEAFLRADTGVGQGSASASPRLPAESAGVGVGTPASPRRATHTCWNGINPRANGTVASSHLACGKTHQHQPHHIAQTVDGCGRGDHAGDPTRNHPIHSTRKSRLLSFHWETTSFRGETTSSNHGHIHGGCQTVEGRSR